MMKRKKTIDSLYYISHIDNVPSILERGILSHSQIEQSHIETVRVYDSQIVSHRQSKKTPDNKSLWDYANLYFQARNPMLYRVFRESNGKEIVVLAIKPQILSTSGAFITTGNAAHRQSEIIPASQSKEKFTQIIEGIDIEWWKTEDGSKRKIMAECLVPNRVSPDSIQAIYVPDQATTDKLKSKIQQSSCKEIPISIDPNLFFLPAKKMWIGDNLSLIEGDMFFSRMQTLTISVNCVGVMGKGLASTAKYRFPDMYVYYEDLCKRKELQLGKPKVYKRESSIFDELAEEISPLGNKNGETWFLLFPTKHHWRNRSELSEIEAGLKWVKENYQRQGIKSLAMPALGCGLGKLDWRDVVPLMYKYLKDLEISVAIYLPTEKDVLHELSDIDVLLSIIEPIR